jgi:glucose/arabinose dehydrogenase
MKSNSMRIFGNLAIAAFVAACAMLLAPAANAQFTITPSAGPGGTISPNTPVSANSGDTKVFDITPNAGYQVANVSVDGVSAGAVTRYVFSNVNASHTIHATFATANPPEGSFQLDNNYITGLSSPTAMAYAPDGRLFITEQAGAVRVVTAQGQLLTQPFLVIPANEMRSDDERGLLGITFDPDFATNNYVYLFYTRNNPGARLSRFTANGNVVVPGSELTLLEYSNISGNHRGGDIHFGPDGKLYLALGDAGEPLNAQSVATYNGKILRLNSDGTIPADNPASFVNTSGQTVTPVGQYRAIWAIGLRNPYRFSFHPTTGKMHINDVGAGLWEEVNLGQAGRNYGWPTCEGMCSNTFAQNPIYVHARGVPECAITGGAFYTGTAFPVEYRNDYFIIDYCTTWLRHLDAANNQPSTFPLAIPGFSVDLKTTPDGSLLVAGHGSGTISRLRFVSNNTNSDPVAVASANPPSGASPPLTVNFSGTGSSDPDNDPLSYAWNFGDGATGSGATTSHTYTAPGLYTATLTVTDGQGGSDTATVSISVGAPPTATILTPAAGTLYTAGNTISFSGSATDPDDGALPASAFSWTVVFHHDSHTHPAVGPVTGVTSGSFTIPSSGHTEENVWYRINLTVTDSTGLQTTVFRDVLPRKANITLSSNVPGTQVLLDGSPVTTPYTFVGVAGVQRTIGVDSPQTVNGLPYTFGAWSDGGAQSHVIVTPASNTTYAVTMNAQGQPGARSLPLDMNGDGRSDVVYRNASTGQVYRLLANGLALSGGAVAYNEANTAWDIVGDGDFDGNGHADLLYRNGVTGQVAIVRYGAGVQPIGAAVFHTEPSALWQVVRTPDIDGDGRSDIVWWNSTTGHVHVMLMNGTTIKAQGIAYAEPDTQWRIVGSGDFTAGGKQNGLLWRNATSGLVYLQTLTYTQGSGFTQAGAVIWNEPSSQWRIVGTADFSGDGKADILWRNTATGLVWMMNMDGGAITSQGPVHNEPSAAWVIVAHGDYNGDGKADLLWRNSSSGAVYMMLMDGRLVASQGAVYAEPNTAWEIVGPASY